MKFTLKKPKQTDGAPKETAPKAKAPKKSFFKKPTAKPKTKKASVPKKKKESFDLKKFFAEVNSLNGQNYGSAPIAVKVFVLAMLVVFIFALAWFLLISAKLDEIKSAEATQESLLVQYKERESKARHLQEYEAQVNTMKTEFTELLNQLPKDTRVPELVNGINMVGSGSGIRFQDISVQPEVEQEFFIEQPIQIIALGNYHQFGSFVSGIAALPRIITMHNFEVKNPQPSLDRVPELQLVLQTKTYRAKEVDLDAVTQDANAQANTEAK